MNQSTQAHLYVSISGNETNPGMMEMPFATMKRTQEVARAHKQQGSVTVHVRAGIHFLPEAAAFTEVDSAIRANQVIFQAFEREPVTIRAGILRDYAWELY